MVISKESNTEDIKVQSFLREGKAIAVNDLILTIGLGEASIAIAAMLKGLEEHYFKPAGMKVDGLPMDQIDQDLETWKTRCANNTQSGPSKIILP